MFIYIFLLLFVQFSAFGSSNSYDLLLKKFQGADDRIDYSDLEKNRCVSIRKSSPEYMLRTQLKLNEGEIWRPRSEARVIPATPDQLDYRHGPLLPPVVIPGQSERVLPLETEILHGRVYLEINGTFHGKREAYLSEALDDKIILRSNEYGYYFLNSSWFEYNFETVVKRSGEFVIFHKKNVYDPSPNMEFVGYCWD